MNKYRYKLKILVFQFLIKYFKSYIDINSYKRKIDKWTNKISLSNKTSFSNEDLRSFSVNLELSKEKKYKILIIGTLQSHTQNRLAFYCNSFCKNISYLDNVVHFYDIYTGKVHLIKNEEYWQYESYKKELYICQLHKIDASQYDKLIYFVNSSIGIIPLYKWAKVNISYFIQDDKNINKVYTDLNKFFDFILTINNTSQISLINNEVYRPIFTIPVSLNLHYYKNISLKHNQIKYNIGCISTPDKLIKLATIIKEIQKKDQNNVSIKLFYTTNDTNAQLPYNNNFKENVQELDKISSQYLEVRKCDTVEFFGQVAEVTSENDCLIYLTKDENFLYNPYQGLCSGKVVLFSDSYNIKSSEQNGIFTFSSIDKNDINYSDIKNKLEKILSQLPNLIAKDKQRKRRAKAIAFDVYENIDVYNNVFQPKNLFLSQKNEIKKDGIYTNDKNLYYKLSKPTININKKLTIVPACDVGFFACLNKFVNYLSKAKESELVIPDWRVSSLQKNIYEYWNTDTFFSFCYGNGKDGNVFFKLFKSCETIPEALKESDLMYEYADKELDLYGVNTETIPNISYIYSYSLYNDIDYFNKIRKCFHDCFFSKFRLLDNIQKQIDDFYNQNLKGYFVISMHIRCSSHALELKEDSSLDVFDKNLIQILKNNGYSKENSKWRLFLATDNDVALMYFKNKYKDHVVYQNDVKRLTIEDENEYAKILEKNKKHIYGYELQARNASSEKNRNIKLAIDILTDAFLLSKAEYFLFKNSNVSTGVSYINPEIKMIYVK